MPPLINPNNTCCFTGHRPGKLPWRDDLTDHRCLALRERLFDIAFSLCTGAGIRHFICGMAQGCDLIFAEEIIRLREELPEITLEAAIPCEAQADRWPAADRERYFRLVSMCDYETLLQSQYTPDCMTKRNRYMVDNSSILIAVYDGSLSGTGNTYHYAEKKGLEIIRLLP